MKTLKHIFIFSFLLLFSNCVTEDDVFEENFKESGITTKSDLVVSLLNELFTKTNQLNNTCFDYIFPIKLSTNLNKNIQINTLNGLSEILSNQNSNSFINGIQLPISLNNKNTDAIINISTTAELRDLFTFCNITTLRASVNEKLSNSCIYFEYPLSVIDIQNQNTIINTRSEYSEFIMNQPNTYEPAFVYPINIFDSEQNLLTINNTYSFYGVLNSCTFENCNTEISITSLGSSGANIYNFNLSDSTTNSSELTNIEWFVNGNEIDNANDLSVEIDFSQFNPGEYLICARATRNNCTEIKEDCIEFIF